MATSPIVDIRSLTATRSVDTRARQQGPGQVRPDHAGDDAGGDQGAADTVERRVHRLDREGLERQHAAMRHAQPADVLNSMIHRMGGARTSIARGSFIDLVV